MAVNGSWHEEPSVYDSDTVLLPESSRLCSPCPTVPVAGGASRLGRKEAFGSQDLMMKREDTHRGNLKLEKMVTENPGSACFSGLGNHLLSPLNQRACHTKDKSGEWPRPDTGCLGLYCEETESCMESIWNF